MEALGYSKGLDISQKHCQTSFFYLTHLFKRNCVTVVFVVTSGLGAVAFTSQVSE